MAFAARGYGSKGPLEHSTGPSEEFIWGYTDSASDGACGNGSNGNRRSKGITAINVIGDGALHMDKGSLPEMAASIQLRSVEAVRKAIMDLKGTYPLFDVSLRSFGFNSDPEGRARLGIAMNQLSACPIERMIIGSGPESEKGADISPLLRKEITRLGVEKRFGWVEYDLDLEPGEVKALRVDTIRTGSRLLLRIDPSIYSQGEISSNFWGCDGIKLSMDVSKRSDLDHLIDGLEFIRKLSQVSPVFVRPRGRYGRMVQSLASLVRGATLCIDPQMHPEREPPFENKPDIGFSQKLMRLHLGLRDDLLESSFSMTGSALTASTGLAFLLGHPVHHSLESILHNRAFKSEGSGGIMIPVGCGSEALDAGVGLLREMAPVGASVTMPLRSLIGRKLDALDVQAKRLGAVNTVKVEGGKLIGHNTEYTAAIDVLRKYVASNDSTVLIMGTGGAGRSIVAASSDLGYRTFMCGSNAERTLQVARSISENVGAIPINSVSKLKGKVTVLVNATPAGMSKAEEKGDSRLGIADVARTLDASFGIDLNYSPPWTSFLSSIESRGGVPVSGFEMLVAEVVRSHQIWTGRSPRTEELKLCAMEAHPIVISE